VTLQCPELRVYTGFCPSPAKAFVTVWLLPPCGHPPPHKFEDVATENFVVYTSFIRNSVKFVMMLKKLFRKGV
jgi:hypothetical protein